MHCQILSVKNDQKGTGQIDFEIQRYVYRIGGVKTGEIERWVYLTVNPKLRQRKRQNWEEV